MADIFNIWVVIPAAGFPSGIAWKKLWFSVAIIEKSIFPENWFVTEWTESEDILYSGLKDVRIPLMEKIKRSSARIDRKPFMISDPLTTANIPVCRFLFILPPFLKLVY
ncbi:hypothetical protein [Peribacillus glennii]|uniref:hypothetical protein n=1 Tax=Peribacillus glennii TaxID=2303991 RepID=UPI002D78791B|nr:hypothetical protein [Peribacillus glennii]